MNSQYNSETYQRFRDKGKLLKSRLWRNSHVYVNKHDKKHKKHDKIPEYQPIRPKFYNNTAWILTFLPTNRVFELKLSITILAVLIIIVFAILYYMYLKWKKII